MAKTAFKERLQTRILTISARTRFQSIFFTLFLLVLLSLTVRGTPPAVSAAPATLGASSAQPGPGMGGGGGTAYYSLNSAAFLPLTSETPYAHYDNLYMLYNPSPYWQTYHAPVLLPDGATITRLTVYYKDDDPDYNVQMALIRLSLDQKVVSVMAYILSEGKQGSIDTGVIIDPRIDSSKSTYLLKLLLPPSPDGDCGFLSVKIDYGFYPENRSNIPLVEK